jgi:hypothetical protein
VGAGPKGRNKCITSNSRYEAGVLYNIYHKRKTNFLYRKHGRRIDFYGNSSVSNGTKEIKVKQSLYRPEQVLRSLEG